MKYAFFAIASIFAVVAQADSFVAGQSSLYSSNNGGKQQYQISISGKSAEGLYQGLNVPENPLVDEHSGEAYGSYKEGKDISCEQTYGSYSCSLRVDAAGKLIR